MIHKYLFKNSITFYLAVIIFCVSQFVFLQVNAALIVTPKNASEEKAMFFKAKPGEVISESFDVINTDVTTSNFALQINDISVTNEGTIALLQNTEKNKQLASWVEMLTGNIAVEPNGKINVPIKIIVPANVKNGEYGAGITLTIQSTDKTGASVKNTIRKGLKLYLLVQNEGLPILSSTVSNLNILNPSAPDKENLQKKLNFWDKNNIVFSFIAQDTGNIFSVIRGKYTIKYENSDEKTGEFTTNMVPNIGEKEYFISTNLPYKSSKTSIKLDYTVEALNNLEIGETINENVSGSLESYIDVNNKAVAQFRGIDKTQDPDYSESRKIKVAKNLIIILISIIGFFAVRKAIKNDNNSITKK
ncbi:MAG: hypothetical protein H7196_01605 [candidate division SR1 bacterium]|nr:hypothetical protein [candidate division SR1 bacterium]